MVEFRVKNFRSLRDEQVLSLVAAPDTSLQDSNTFSSTARVSPPRLLRSAVIYGPNAGGKSNLLKALQHMKAIIKVSATVIKPDDSLGMISFLLDGKSSELPTEFEVTFIPDDVRYQYGFAATSKRVFSEHLLVYKTNKPQQWFTRKYRPSTVVGQPVLRREEGDVDTQLFRHVTELGEATFSIEDQSQGTQTLLCLAGPIFTALDKGLTLVVDELDSSLHPLLVRQLIEFFHDLKRTPWERN